MFTHSWASALDFYLQLFLFYSFQRSPLTSHLSPYQLNHCFSSHTQIVIYIVQTHSLLLIVQSTTLFLHVSSSIISAFLLDSFSAHLLTVEVASGSNLRTRKDLHSTDNWILVIATCRLGTNQLRQAHRMLVGTCILPKQPLNQVQTLILTRTTTSTTTRHPRHRPELTPPSSFGSESKPHRGILPASEDLVLFHDRCQGYERSCIPLGTQTHPVPFENYRITCDGGKKQNHASPDQERFQ